MKCFNKYIVTFNEEFFDSLANRWLNNKEIYILLLNIEELVSKNVVKLSSISESTGNINLNQSKNYSIISYSNYGFLLKENYNKKRYYNIRINSLEKIKVFQCSNLSQHRRAYFLLENPRYIFIHYRVIEQKDNNIEKLNYTKININYTPINIIDFNPVSIEEDKENQKLFLVIKSKFSTKDLQNLIPYISISFGKKFVKYEVISDGVLSCFIPPQKKREVIIDIYFSNKSNGCMSKISVYSQKNKKSFSYTQKIIDTKNKNNNKSIDTSLTQINSITENSDLKSKYEKYAEKKGYKIFNFGINEIIVRVTSIFDYLLSHINYYKENNDNNDNIIMNSENEEKIDLSIISTNSRIEGGGFNEINLNIILEKILKELTKINKVYLCDICDEEGYNLLHYLSALNFQKSLIILNNNKINFREKSKDNLTVYEICAGKRNLECLLAIIEIMEKQETEEKKIFYDLDVLKSALFLSLEKEAADFDDVQMLNALLKQIKIKYMVDSISGKIIDNVTLSTKSNKKPEAYKSELFKKRNVRKIQRAVKCWLKRNKYKSLQKAANTLIEKMKSYCDRKKFLKFKNAAKLIQHEIRNWLKHKNNKEK